MNSWKAFSASCWLSKCFPCKNLFSLQKFAWGKTSYPNLFNFSSFGCAMQLGILVEKNWDLFVDQCQLQALQFLVHLINLLSILLRCNGVPEIQKAAVDQTGSRPPHSDHDLFLVQAWLWEVLWIFFSVQPLSCHIKSTFCRMSQSDWEMVHCCCAV